MHRTTTVDYLLVVDSIFYNGSPQKMNRSDRKIWFIGTGFIWWNMAQDFKDRSFDVVQYSLGEPYKKNKDKLKWCDTIFVAVPTPTINRKHHDEILYDAIKNNTHEWQNIVIKSTVKVWTTDKLQNELVDRKLFHSAEFLTEANALNDVKYPSRNIVGYTERSQDDAPKVMEILPYSKHNLITTAKESELWKYMSNFLLTGKLLLANLIFDLVTFNNIDYNKVAEIAGLDPRIWPSHLQVEWVNWERGACGHCFPKDLSTLSEMYAEILWDDYEIGKHLLEMLEMYNKNIAQKSWKDQENMQQILWY